jgi:hypothetical protein
MRLSAAHAHAAVDTPNPSGVVGRRIGGQKVDNAGDLFGPAGTASRDLVGESGHHLVGNAGGHLLCAIAAPIPRVPRVTKATRPASLGVVRAFEDSGSLSRMFVIGSVSYRGISE